MLALGRVGLSEGGSKIDSRLAEHIHLDPGLNN
jgi:hypothetical protein